MYTEIVIGHSNNPSCPKWMLSASLPTVTRFQCKWWGTISTVLKNTFQDMRLDQSKHTLLLVRYFTSFRWWDSNTQREFILLKTVTLEDIHLTRLNSDSHNEDEKKWILHIGIAFGKSSRPVWTAGTLSMCILAFEHCYKTDFNTRCSGYLCIKHPIQHSTPTFHVETCDDDSVLTSVISCRYFWKWLAFQSAI